MWSCTELAAFLFQKIKLQIIWDSKFFNNNPGLFQCYTQFRFENLTSMHNDQGFTSLWNIFNTVKNWSGNNGVCFFRTTFYILDEQFFRSAMSFLVCNKFQKISNKWRYNLKNNCHKHQQFVRPVWYSLSRIKNLKICSSHAQGLGFKSQSFRNV